jgi:Trp operon repressor
MRRHIRYARRMAEILDGDLIQPGVSERLTDSLALADRGLMTAPPEFRRWLENTGRELRSSGQSPSGAFRPDR